MNDKWIISLDADDTTLVSGDKQVVVDGTKVPTTTEYNLKVISKLNELGHLVILNTGRGWFGAEKVYKAMGLKSFASTSAGALVLDPQNNNEVILDNPINRDVAIEIAKDLLDRKIIQQIYFDGLDYCHTYVVETTPLIEHVSTNRRVTIKEELEPSFNPYNIVISLDITLEESQLIIKELNDKYGDDIYVTNYQRNSKEVVAIEINSIKCDKGDVIVRLAEKYNINKDHTIAIGDGENDLEMLKKASISAVVANAVPTAKAVATIQLDRTNNESAVGHFLNKHFNLGIEE